MHYRFVRALLLLTVLLSFSNVRAQSTDQNYPVTAQPFIVSQPNQRLSSYFSSSTALTVNLLLKDLTKNSIQVYLKWSMEGPGVRVSSMDGYIPANLITLDKGTIRRFSGLDLQNDYFRQDLIEEQGLGGSPLRTNLPEGFYTFRVQALEAGTGREVSNIGETYFSITTPLPPIINIPFNGAELTMTEPQRINIQWMPRHYRMPGNITSYDLKVCKVPDGYEPTEALDACVNPVIDDKGNPGTFYPGNTGIGSSLIGALERGARYAARVTVHEFDTDGNEVVFVNEGRSEVNWFRYGKECISPESFTIKETGPGRLQLNWEAQADAAQAAVDSYKVLYRKAGDDKWNVVLVISAGVATVQDLAVGTYEFVVQISCTNAFPDNIKTYLLQQPNDAADSLNPSAITLNGLSIGRWSALLDSLPIPCAAQVSQYESCSSDHPVVTPVGTKPLTSLSSGDILTIYDMAVIVTEVTGGDSFSGKGLARLPYLKNASGGVPSGSAPLTPVEFRGVKAWKAEETTKGGCVYQVDGYFRTYAVIDSTFQQPNTPPQDTTKPSIRYVVVNPITSNTASISWIGDHSFKRYIVRYKTRTGGELQQEIGSESMTLVNLRESTPYSFSVEALDLSGNVLALYNSGAFTTTGLGLDIPKNIKPVKKDSSSVLITWDKDPAQLSFKLIYLDKTGQSHTIYPTTNSITIGNLDSTQVYPFTLTALGKSGTGAELISDAVEGIFFLNNVALRTGADGDGTDNGGDGDNADDFDQGRDLAEAIITGSGNMDDYLDLYNGYFDEPPMDDPNAFVDLQTLSPSSPMTKRWKGLQSFTKWSATYCPTDPRAMALVKYSAYVIAGLTSELGTVIAGGAVTVANFVNSIIGNVASALEKDPGKNTDQVFAEIYYKQTIVEFQYNPNQTGPLQEAQICSPAPAWIRDMRECELLFVKNTGTKTNLPVLVVDKNGNSVDIVNASQTASGDYYYKNAALDTEYWKLKGTYLVGRVKGKEWIYWNIALNKWCGFTPALFGVKVVESVGVCEAGQTATLGGEIKLQVINGQAPYQFSDNGAPAFTSQSPTFVFDNLGGSLHDFKVTDSRGCETTLKGQYVQYMPSLGFAVKLRKCNNSVLLEPICGRGPYSFSMDGKTYQSSNEFTGIQEKIGPKNQCTNGLSKSFTFYVKDSQGKTAQKDVTIKRNDYITMGVRDYKRLTFPGYKDEEFVQCSINNYKNIHHVNQSSGVLVSHTEKFCNEVKGSIRLDSRSVSNDAAPYTYTLSGPGGVSKTVVTESPNYKFEGLEPGHYQISGEDGNGCAVESFHSTKSWSGYDSQSIDILDASLSMQVVTEPIVCFDGLAKIDIGVKGGAFKRDFAINTAATGGYYIPGLYLVVNNTYVGNFIKEGTPVRGDSNFPANSTTLYRPAGNYEVSVTDYLGCSVKQTVKLTSAPALVLTPKIYPPTRETSASVQIIASGGTTPYQEFVMFGPGIKDLRQTDDYFSNLLPGHYTCRLTDASGCDALVEFEIGEPLSLTTAVTNATCAGNGSVSLTSSGGVPPFRYSSDGATFQENAVFNKLEAGEYTFTVSDSQNGTATAKATVVAPSEIIVVPAESIPTLRVGATGTASATGIASGAGTVAEEGFIEVSYNPNTRKTTFKLKAGFDLKPTVSGEWVLTVNSSDPEDQKLAGKYRAYFDDCDLNMFIGFYKEDYNQVKCTSDRRKHKVPSKILCKEAWLPESILIEKIDIVVLYGGGDLLNTDDVGSAGIIVDNVKDQYDSKLDIKAFDSDYWGVGIEDVTSLNIATEKAFRFIQTKLNKELESVIIYGYSWGGVLAQHLTKRLKESSITIKLLITIDAAAGPQSNEISRIINDNVEENLNIYQTEPSIIRSRGYPNTAENSQKTLIDNNDYSNNFLGTPGESDFVQTTHSTIDEMALPRVIKKIIDTLNSK